MASNTTLGWARVDAIDALSQAPVVEQAILGRITAEVLMSVAAPVAAFLAALVGVHAPVEEATVTFETVGQSRDRRALILIGARILEERDREAAARLLDLLDLGHPARRILDPSGEPLPSHILDDLGEPRIRKHVRAWLQDLMT